VSDQPWLQRLSQFASIAAPSSVAAALLFYFGYVATYARYLYFGVDLTALDLSTTDVVFPDPRPHTPPHSTRPPSGIR
jgi:hypothetical protein